MKARVLKTIRSQINSLRNTLLPRQSGAVEGEAYSNTGEPFQRSAGSIVQLTEEGRVIEAPDVKVVEEIAKKVSDQRTAELEAILADGVGAEYCGATLSATLTNTDPSLTLTPTIGEANGFSVDGQSIVASKAGRYGVSFVATLEGDLWESGGEGLPPLELRACVNGTSVETQTRKLSLGRLSDFEWEKQWSLELVLDLKEGDELTFELEVIDWWGESQQPEPFEVNASASLSVWCVSARKASAGGGTPITTKGDLIYGDASGEAERLPVGADGKVLKVVSGLPSWEDGGIPPSVFFPTDEASLLEALAADGVRTIIMSQPIILTDNTIPIGSSVCNLTTHDCGGVSTLILAPTNSTATTLTGGGAVIYVDGDLSTLGFVLNGVEIYCKRMSVGGDRTVTATTTEKLYYERIDTGSLTGAVEQLYWSNTYTPQPATIGTTELTPAVVNRLSPPSTAFVSTVPQFLTALSDATIKEIRVTEHITATSQALEINGDKQIYGTLTIDGTTTTSGDGYPHFNDPLTLGGTLTTVKEWRCTRVSGTVSVTGSLVYEWTDGVITGGVQGYWKNTNDSSGGASVITTKGDLIVGDASGAEARLPIGTAGQVLSVVGGTVGWEEIVSGGESKVATHSKLVTPYDLAGGWHKIAESPSGSFTPCLLSLGYENEDTGGTDTDYDHYLNMVFIVGKKGKTAELSMIYNASKRNNQSVPVLDGGGIDGIKIADGAVWIHQMYQIRSGYYRVPIAKLRVEIRDLGFAITGSSSLQVIPSTTTEQVGQLAEPVGTVANSSLKWDSFYRNGRLIGKRLFDHNNVPYSRPCQLFAGDRNAMGVSASLTIINSNHTITGVDQRAIRIITGARTITIPKLDVSGLWTEGNGSNWSLYPSTHDCTLEWASGVTMDGVNGAGSTTLHKGSLYFVIQESTNIYHLIRTDGFKPTGATGSFTDPDGKIVTVTNGLITAITPP